MSTATKKPDFMSTFWGTVLKGVATAMGISVAFATWSIFKSVQMIPEIVANQHTTDSTVVVLTRKLTKLEEERRDKEREAEITERILTRMEQNVSKNDSLSLRQQLAHEREMADIARKPIILYRDKK